MLSQVVSNEIVRKICNITIPLQDSKDVLVWGPNTNGKFFVKSSTWIQKGTLTQSTNHKLINKM